MKMKLPLSLLLVTGYWLLTIPTVNAQCVTVIECVPPNIWAEQPPCASSLGICSPPAASSTELSLPNPLGTANVPIIVGRIIKVLSGGAGTIGLLMFVYGGFQWLTSGGNAEKIKKGKDIILWSVIGLVVMFSSYIATKYILDALTTTTR